MALGTRTLSAAGHRIHAVEAGTGPLVLMIHGFPESAHSWRHQMTALADAGYHAVAIDQLGYGRSAKPRAVEEKRITRLVDVAVGVVEALGESTATIVGHDWGAPVACFRTPEKLPDWLPQEDLDVYVEEYERSGMTTAFNSYRTNDLDWELLGPYADTPLRVPALFVGGDRDVPTIWGREALRRFDEVATDVRGSVVLEECGHWVQQEKPEEFNRVLLEFLRGL
jgi:pimeloyl-ACP methyl ester carboxylesterase